MRATPSGTTFTLPAGWTLMVDGGLRLLVAPEKDIKVAIAETSAGSSAEAVEVAWHKLDPTFARYVHDETPLPARNGWQNVRGYSYETSPIEQRHLYGITRRHGTGWCVTLIDGSRAARERRAAQIALIRDSVRPAGYIRESFAGKHPHALDARRLALLIDFASKTRFEAGVPGVALGLIQNGTVVFAGGFGVRELGKLEPVDPETLFFIASNTKALTTLLLAKEVDVGKFTWDTPVTAVYPLFKLGDPDTTGRVLIKHLVCACTGMPNSAPNLFFSRSATPADTLARLATMTPTSRFGEVYQYSNGMAAAAGFVGAFALYPHRELGVAYDEAMRREVFVPLGMTSTTFDFAQALTTKHASPHAEDLDGKTSIASMTLNYMVVPGRPAGGAWSNLNDLLRYVRMELTNGKLPDGKQFVSEAALLARRAPQVSMAEDQSYGMGLMIDQRYGVEMIHHSGMGVGYLSAMFWIPEARVGGVILTNSDQGQRVFSSFQRRLLEMLYDGRPEAEEDVAFANERHKDTLATERKVLVVPAEARAAAKLASRYSSPDFGPLIVTRRGGETVFDFGEWQSRMASKTNADGSVSFVTVAPGGGRFEFVAGDRDGRSVLTWREPQHKHIFVAQ